MARVALTDDNGALYGAPATWLDGRFTPTAEQAKLVNLVFDGDSLTWGHSSTSGRTYPAQTVEGIYADVNNFGVSGQGAGQMLSDATTQVDPVYDAAKKNIVLAWAGTNDLAGAGVTTHTSAYNNVVSYHQGRQAAGFQTVAFTILPRTGTPDDAMFETVRTAFNDQMRANWQNYADALVDVGADPTIGAAGVTTNTTYYSDGTHLTNAGYAIVARLARKALRDLGVTGMHDHTGYAAVQEQVFVPATAFVSRGTQDAATKTLTTSPVGVTPFWEFGDGVNAQISATVMVPREWKTFKIEAVWASGSTDSALVAKLNMFFGKVKLGELHTAVTQYGTTATGSPQGIIAKSEFTGSGSPHTVDPNAYGYAVSVQREGTHATDTLTSVLRVFGVRLVRVS